MINRNDIKNHMKLVCKDGAAFVVDHLDGNYIQLARDDAGHYHWIPLAWVEAVTAGTAKVNKTGQEMRDQWKAERPARA